MLTAEVLWSLASLPGKVAGHLVEEVVQGRRSRRGTGRRGPGGRQNIVGGLRRAVRRCVAAIRCALGAHWSMHMIELIPT